SRSRRTNLSSPQDRTTKPSASGALRTSLHSGRLIAIRRACGVWPFHPMENCWQRHQSTRPGSSGVYSNRPGSDDSVFRHSQRVGGFAHIPSIEATNGEDDMAWERRCIVLITILSLIGLARPVSAATSFARPEFQKQWEAGEANIPNFWGPLDTALD